MKNYDLFGEEIEEEQEDDTPLEKPKKLSPFDFIGSVSETKNDLLKDDPESQKDYAAYVVNRGLGYFPDTVLYANEMNLYPEIPSALQYYYYFASLRKRNRRSKWFKLENDDDIRLVREVYGVRAEVAKDFLRVLTDDDLATLRDLVHKGETASKKKKNK